MGTERVFVFGSGRSGTTLLAKLIDSSPHVLYRHEPDKVRPSNEFPYLPEPEEYERFSDVAKAYLGQLFSERLPGVVGKQPFFPKYFRTSGSGQVYSLLLSLLGLAEKAHLSIPVPDLVRGEDHFEVVKSVNSVCRVPLFDTVDPDLRFLHLVRHPGAVVASVLKGIEQGFMGREDYLESVSTLSSARKLNVDIERVRSAGFAQRSAYVWMVQNDKTFGEMAGKPNYLMLSYEDLCVNMVDRVSDICGFIGVDFDNQMRAFVDLMSGADTSAGYFSVIRNPVAAISRWEESLGKETADAISELIEVSAVGRFALDRYHAATAVLGGRAGCA